ncbi:MAG: family 43 glycosylhydrolase [Blautia wexlerae]
MIQGGKYNDKNPILPGFNPDPCICRKGDDYYMAVSTFEWFPGIPIYHSRDLKNWELYTHVLTDDEEVDLKKLPSAKGIWAPCLTYCEAEDMVLCSLWCNEFHECQIF